MLCVSFCFAQQPEKSVEVTDSTKVVEFTGQVLRDGFIATAKLPVYKVVNDSTAQVVGEFVIIISRQGNVYNFVIDSINPESIYLVSDRLLIQHGLSTTQKIEQIRSTGIDTQMLKFVISSSLYIVPLPESINQFFKH